MVLLTRLNRLVYRYATEEALGMRLKQFAVLSVLRDHGAMPQQTLGEQMHVDPNNLVLLLNDSEASGWLERRRDPTDRRRHIVVLTEAGEHALSRAEHAIEEVEGQVLGPLDAEERATLRRLLQKAAAGDRATAAA
jgi:DNA-binding MarR family transcriptional regulator